MISSRARRAACILQGGKSSGTSAISRPLSSTTAREKVGKDELLLGLKAAERKAVWLSSYLIHNANNIRVKRDGLKVGGHQASSSSMSTILTALYFSILREKDRVAVKPHASPMFHSLQYLLGNQTLDQLQRFRSFGGIQSYPSRTKDSVDVDFSTGSVGLGATITSFMSMTQDWLLGKGITPKHVTKDAPATMITLIGDAELDEGNVFEGLVESWKAGIKNNYFVVDYNRQSLDKISEESNWKQIDKMFRMNGWEVVNVKYGKKLQAAFDPSKGGKALKRFFNACPNDTYSALVYRGGGAFRKEISMFMDGYASNTAPPGYDSASSYDPLDPQEIATLRAWLGSVSDSDLHTVLTNLGGHDFETLLDAFEQASKSSQRTAFICYTIKGHMLPLAGHRDNHGSIMNGTQISALQQAHGVPVGDEWSPTAGLSPAEARALNALVACNPLRRGPGKHRDYSAEAEVFPIPETFLDKSPAGMSALSTQTAFGGIMLNIAKSKHAFADRIMTMAPDVATSTNLGGFVGARGVFGLKEVGDSSKKLQVVSAVKWDVSPRGQHVELGIAENNLFLAMAAAGLSHSLFAKRVIPVGTLYDPFISRGLDGM
jgi:pyruvate dehydrogenase E1 component